MGVSASYIPSNSEHIRIRRRSEGGGAVALELRMLLVGDALKRKRRTSGIF